jgi:hypothetical protein
VQLEERMKIRRVLTDTVLARQHERVIARGAPRKRVDIPWKAFVRSKYPAPALALACKAQTMLAQGEYEAVDLFSRIASALALNGAPTTRSGSPPCWADGTTSPLTSVAATPSAGGERSSTWRRSTG